MEEEKNTINPKSLPIYKKAKEIFDVVYKIGELIPEDNEALQTIKRIIISDAVLLTVKISGATRINVYDLKMESATIIRKTALNLKIQNHSLRMFGFKEVQYYEIVRDLIDEFRLLFIKWVNGFDQNNYIIDRWGLFNPHGVGPFDSDLPCKDNFPFDE